MDNKAALIGLAILAFLIALLLVVAIGKMLFGGRLRLPGGRARQPRLGIVDAFDLDRQRQLIIVRRDNTEHLIMIGGPNDLLIESEIVRVEARETRRDKEPGFGDARIPAPLPPIERADPPSAGAPQEPMLPMPMPPMPMPEAPLISADQAAPPSVARPSAFPLPPRRPAPPNEPAGVPPAGAERGGDARAPMPEAASALQAPVVPVEPMAKPPQRPPFLKPLPPRPPIRPLRRTTPQAAPPPDGGNAGPLRPEGPLPPQPSQDGSIGSASVPAAPPQQLIRPKPPEAPRPVPQAATQPGFSPPPSKPQPQPSPGDAKPPQPPGDAKPSAATPPPSSTPAVKPSEEPKDALESLEEEMAKLLGRGPG